MFDNRRKKIFLTSINRSWTQYIRILQRIIIINFCGPVSHLRKVQYQIWNPHRISKSKKKKKFKSVHKHGNWRKSTISDLKTPSNFRVKEKKYSNRSINKEIGLMWSIQSFGESTISDLESPSNFKVKEEEKKFGIGQETMKLYN